MCSEFDNLTLQASQSFLLLSSEAVNVCSFEDALFVHQFYMALSGLVQAHFPCVSNSFSIRAPASLIAELLSLKGQIWSPRFKCPA